MKKIISSIAVAVFAGASLFGATTAKAFAAEDLSANCKSAYLCDFYSGECVYKSNETARMPIASVCKVMTLTLCLDAIDEGKISLDDRITVSDNAAGMGGSQVFLQSGLTYSLDELIKSVVVCSANDSCVAISEYVCGSEQTFVDRMNERAEALGCTDTRFSNCTGLPKQNQYSCAKDVAIMFSNLAKHETYFKYSKIWLEDFSHPDNRTTTITNTNKLIKKYGPCDGGKTGFTNEAGFCLAATAVKDNLRLISVVLGADSSDNRFAATVKMFNYGFANYKNKIVLDGDVNLNDKLNVQCGKKDSISVKPARSCSVFSKHDQTPNVTRKITLEQVKAPVAKGQTVGKVEVFKDGILYDTVPVLAAEEVQKASFGDNLKKIASDWQL